MRILLPLQPDRAVCDPGKCAGIERDIGAEFRVEHEQRIGDRSRVKSLAREIALLLLERLGRIELARDANEDWPGVSRQALPEITSPEAWKPTFAGLEDGDG